LRGKKLLFARPKVKIFSGSHISLSDPGRAHTKTLRGFFQKAASFLDLDRSARHVPPQLCPGTNRSHAQLFSPRQRFSPSF
jgi:hypothetical protein